MADDGQPACYGTGCQKRYTALRPQAGVAAAYERRMTLETSFEFIIKNAEGKRIARSQAFATTIAR